AACAHRRTLRSLLSLPRPRDLRRSRRPGQFAQPRLHRLNFASIPPVALDTQHARFPVDRLDTVARVRVIAEELRSATAALPFDRLEHAGHRTGAVTRTRHQLGAQQARLAPVLTAA